jgi:zinc protease
MSILTTLAKNTPIFLWGVLFSFIANAETLKPLTHEFQLSNGMKVVVREDHRAPTVAHMVWYRAGSVDEVSGKTGVAHVLEHMMFKGTKNLAPGEFSKKVAEVGGRDNAFTSKDYTAYFQQIEKSHLEKMMALEADRMANLQITEEEFLKELQVVMEERRLRTDDQPQAIVNERLYAAAFENTPYRNPIIGWMTDLESMTYLDAKEWYENWYAPNNAVLVVAGDVGPEDVLRLAKKYYEPLQAKNLPIRKPQIEVNALGIKRIEVKVPAENPDLTMAWQVPKLNPNKLDVAEPYALQVLAAILDGHANSRMNRILVRDKRIADSVDASYGALGRGPQLFTLGASISKKSSPSMVESEIRNILKDIAVNGVTDVELNRVKTQLMAAQVYKKDSVFGQAMEIGVFEMNQVSWKYADDYVAAIGKVNSSQIKEVINKYLRDDNLTIAFLNPQPMDLKKTTNQSAPLRLRH